MQRYNWVEWGGQGPQVVFAHANGFPIGSYKPLLDVMAGDFHMTGWETRALQPGAAPQEILSWNPLAGDLTAAIEDRFVEPVIAVGHSLGGVLILKAAATHPELFKAVVLLDPVLFSGSRSLVWGMMKRLGQAHRIPLRAGAMRRRDVWPNREAVRKAWTGKAAFKGWTPESFDAYIQAGFEEDGTSDTIRLRYPKAWEARIFELTPHDVWDEVATLQVKVMVLRGEHSDTFLSESAAKFERKVRHGFCRVVDGTGHMFPMQKPETVACLIKEWLVNP